MAQWYHLFSLLSVMCMSFGALYIVFNSDYNEVCDYSGIIDSCDEKKVYTATDVEQEKKKLHADWLFQAQELRNESEKMKCDTERNLLQDLQDMEKAEADRIVTKCLTDFRACVEAGYVTTTPGPIETDCTSCNRFCTMNNWDNIDPSYAIAMGFTGMCSKTVCPWLPACGMGKFIHEKCSKRGCVCNKVPCPTTTPSLATPAPAPSPPSTTTSTVTAGSTSTVTAGSTTTATTTAGTTSSTTEGTTTTATTSTSTSTITTTTTWTTTTATTSTSTTSTTTSTTSTTITTTVITTTTLTTTTTSTTTITTVKCDCPAGLVGTVIVGRPYQTFFQPEDHVWTPATVQLMQGVNVMSDTALPIGGMLTQSCKSYFSDRTNYFGPQQQSDPVAREEARNSHFDLGCGYSGNFNIKCSLTGGQCVKEVDISTCSPPTFAQALDDCYSAVMTTLPPYVGVESPKVPDWLGVELINFTIAELPAFFNITTQTTTAQPCCEVHVGSVCRPEVNFDNPLVGKTVEGRWQPGPSYNRSVGYFPVVPCDQQAKSVPRQCPRVKINQISAAYTQWPHCMSVCNAVSAQKEFAQICNRTSNEELETKEQAAHKAKIDIQKAKSNELESWTQQRMPTVLEEKHVIDCFDDRLPRRYNSMSLPKMRSGFSTMPLHKECRLHGCLVNQCLQVKKKCKVPFVHEAPENMCKMHKDEGQFECVEKVEISSNNPLSLGFGVAWMVIGGFLLCAAIGAFVRSSRPEGNPERETMALAVAPTTLANP